MKKFFTREAKIGLLVIVALGLLYFGINYLKGINLFKPTKYFYVQYDRIDGVVKTSPVLINGYKIGHVSNIDFDYTKNAPITLEISVDKHLIVPKGSYAELYETGMLGDKAIQLVLTDNPDIHQIGDTLPGKTSGGLIGEIVNSLLPPIQKVIPQVDSTLLALCKVIESGAVENSMKNIETTTQELASMSQSLKKIVHTDVPVIMNDVSTVTQNLSKVTTDLSKVDLEKTLISLNETLANLQLASSKFNEKTNTVGLLLNDPSLYLNLNATMDSSNKLLIDLKENPKRYIHFSVFGAKKEKK